MSSIYSQGEYEIRCEWGLQGLKELAPGSDALVIVDVLSFSTSVDIAVNNGAIIYPYRWRDARASTYAASIGAQLAGAWDDLHSRYSLSPQTLLELPAGTRLVLPSPNGATLSLEAGEKPTFTACLRNAAAVARAALHFGPRVSVIPAGERWDRGELRPALEDLIGTGALIAQLPGSSSPEAEAAVAVFRRFESDLPGCLQRCSSGKESTSSGRAADIALAAALNVSNCAPLLQEGAFVRFIE